MLCSNRYQRRRRRLTRLTSSEPSIINPFNAAGCYSSRCLMDTGEFVIFQWYSQLDYVECRCAERLSTFKRTLKTNWALWHIAYMASERQHFAATMRLSFACDIRRFTCVFDLIWLNLSMIDHRTVWRQVTYPGMLSGIPECPVR